MDIDLQKEAPNVVTEPRFRKLLASGYQAEVVCREEAYIKSAVWYGEWFVRVVDRERRFEKLLVTTPRRVGDADEIKIRVFKTINGLASFMHRMGFTHLNVPFEQGGQSSQTLPDEVLETNSDG